MAILKHVQSAVVFAIATILSTATTTATPWQKDETANHKTDHGFFLTKVETQLQKRLLLIDAGDQNPTYYLGLNANLFYGERHKQSLAALEKKLTQLEDESPRVFVHTTYYNKMPSGNQQGENNTVLASLLKTSNVQRLRSSTSFSSGKASTQYIGPGSQQDYVAEGIVMGDQQAMVYAVNTPLSRFLTSGAGCYIEITSTLKEIDGFINRETRDRIKKHISNMNLNSSDVVLFRFYNLEASSGWQTRLRDEFNQFAESLGFASARFKYNPGKVQLAESEALVGGVAPDFSLPDFSTGNEVKMSQISRGKFVVLNFYGNT